MRRIALGLPLVVGTLALQGGGCFCDGERESVLVSEQLRPDGGPISESRSFCAPCLDYTPEGKWLVDCAVDADGRATECVYEFDCTGGRRPEARALAMISPAASPRERWLLEMATMEAESVPAFRSLARGLAHHRAPAELVARAERSADDEMRHTQLALQLAASGAIRVEVPHNPVPSLEALACHNAREGCVREAYGALEAAYQSEHADDAPTREAFAEIARDEARHALLSLDIDAWARGRVNGSLLDRARDEARRELDAMLGTRSVPCGLGLPCAHHARALLSAVA